MEFICRSAGSPWSAPPVGGRAAGTSTPWFAPPGGEERLGAEAGLRLIVNAFDGRGWLGFEVNMIMRVGPLRVTLAAGSR